MEQNEPQRKLPAIGILHPLYRTIISFQMMALGIYCFWAGIVILFNLAQKNLKFKEIVLKIEYILEDIKNGQ